VKRIAFVSGKYRAATISGTVANIRAAEECARELWAMGYSVICPHANSALMDGIAGDSVFLDGYLEMLRRLDPATDIVVALKGWQQSPGAVAEFALAAELGLPIEYWPENRWALADLIERDQRAEQAALPGPYCHGKLKAD